MGRFTFSLPPDDPNHRQKYGSGWTGWKNEWKSCLLLIGGLVLCGLVFFLVIALVNSYYR